MSEWHILNRICVKECGKARSIKKLCLFKRMYCPGKGHELLSVSAVFTVCQDSSIFLMRLLPLSIISAFLKAMV